jgi:hypothetical protein
MSGDMVFHDFVRETKLICSMRKFVMLYDFTEIFIGKSRKIGEDTLQEIKSGSASGN